MSYKALVTRIATREHPNADKLQIGSCGGYQVIVGKDVQNGELGLFFEQGGQLSEEFAIANDLVRRRDEAGNAAGGMFEPNRRVKAISLRGVRSEGFWCELNKLAFVGDYNALREGNELDEFNGIKICCKYETPATRAGRGGWGKGKVRKENSMFAKHFDTLQYRREKYRIPADALVYITEKLHGTSARLGHVLDTVPIKRNRVSRFLAWLLRRPKTERQWRYLHGSRNVVLEHNNGNDGYYSDNFRFNAVRGIELHKGEVLYGEIVGYTTTGAAIMQPQTTKKLPEITKQYGPTMTYSYGCEPGECRFFVYRVTQVNEDGIVTELSWNDVQKRCKQLGLNAVPQVCPVMLGPPDQDHPQLTAEGPSVLDDRHIAEGVVIRYESPDGTGWLKNKTYTFSVLEGILKETDTYVDTEEVS